MLYCLDSLFDQRYAAPGYNDASSQLRPGMTLADELETWGLLHHVNHYTSNIIPQIHSPHVQEFYFKFGTGSLIVSVAAHP
jgi:hypothetical protein